MPRLTHTEVPDPRLESYLLQGIRPRSWTPADPIPPDACGRAEEAPRQAYVTAQPFHATAMTLGEFRSCHHHAGYEGPDSERGFLVELPAGAVTDKPSQPPPKVWIGADTFARTYRPLRDLQPRDFQPQPYAPQMYEQARDALNALRDRNGLPPLAPQTPVDPSGREPRTYRGGIPQLHEIVSGTSGLPTPTETPRPT